MEYPGKNPGGDGDWTYEERLAQIREAVEGLIRVDMDLAAKGNEEAMEAEAEQANH